MDPISIAGTAVSLVVPLLAKKGAEIASQVGEKVWDAVSEKASGIWKAIKRRFSGDDKAEATIKGLEEKPEDADRQKATLEILEGADSEFLETLAKLIEDAKRAGGDKVIEAGRDVIKISGPGVVGTDEAVVAVDQSHAAGRDLTIGAPPPSKDKE